jgi:hypothetical protein
MPLVVLNWLTAADITSEDVAEQFFALMKAHIPDHVPSVCGDVEPLSVPFNDTGQVRSLWPDGLHWQGRKGKRKGDFGIEGNVGHGKFWHTWIRHWYKVMLPNREDVIGFLREASQLFKVDYSYVHVFGESKPSPEDDLLQGLVSHELQASLPTIPWACCFGPPYLTMIGRDRIASAPFWKVEDIGSGLLLCQAVQDPSECLGPEFNARREAIKAAIGLEYFFDPAHPRNKAVVPRFSFLRSHKESSAD